MLSDTRALVSPRTDTSGRRDLVWQLRFRNGHTDNEVLRIPSGTILSHVRAPRGDDHSDRSAFDVK